MKLDQLLEMFVKHAGSRKDGPAYIVPTDTDVTCYIALEGETLAVAKVARVEVDGALLCLDTAKSERFVVLPEDVRAFKIERSESSRRERSPGFNR